MSRFIFSGTTDDDQDYRKKLYEMSQQAQNKPSMAISDVKTKTKSRPMTEDEILEKRFGTKEGYQATKKQLKDEKKEAWKDHLRNMAKDVVASTYSIVNTNDKTLALAKASDEVRKQSKEVKDSYNKKIADLDNARNEYNIAEATEQLKDTNVNDKVAELYRNKLAMDGQASVGNQKASQQATTSYSQQYKELKDQGYDVEKLLDVYGRQSNAKTAENIKKSTEEFVKDSPAKAVVANVGSVLFNDVSGSWMLGALESKTKELLSGEPAPIDTSSKYFTAGNLRDTIRSTTDEEIQKNIHNDTLKKIASFTYQTGMSIGDFLSVSWMPSPASLAVMAGSAGASATKQVVENGGTTSQALMTGLAAGGAEVLFEKLSLDNFKALTVNGGKGFKTFAKNVLKQSITEGSEELFTDIANRVSDDLINGGLSQYNLSVEQYKAQGLSEQEAKDKANTDFAKQLGMSFAGGALSGSVIGSVGSAIGNARYNSYAKSVGKNIQATNNIQATVDKGLTADTNSKVYQLALKVADKMKNDEKVSPYSIGNLHNEMSSVNFDKNIMPAVQDRLAQLRVNDESNAISEAIVKRLSREKVSMTDNGIIQNNPVAKRIISEYENNYNDQFSNEWARKVTENEYIPQSTETGIANVPQNVPQEATKSTFNFTDTNSNVTEESQSGKPVTNISAKPNAVKLIDSGEEVEIKEIEKTSDGKVALRTSNNKHITLEQVSFSSPETEQVYKTAMQMPSKGTADKFIRSYNANKEDGGTASLQLFTEAFNRMYDAGKRGENLDKKVKKSGYIANGSISLLSASQAFFAGQEEANRANSVIIGSKKYGTGVTNLSKIPLSKAQATQIEILNNVSKATGASIVVADGLTDEKGFEGSFGAYKDGTVYINVAKVGDGINYTAGHELVHFIKSENAELYKKLEKVVVNELKSSDSYNFDEQVQNKINQYWKADQQLTRAEAIEEIVAESCFDVLSNEQSVSKIVETDWKLARKIKDWLSDFIAKLKEVAEKIGRGRPEYKALHNNIEALENISEAFYSALDGIKNTSTNSDGKVKYSIETIEGTDKKFVKADRQVLKGDNANEWRGQITNYINSTIRNGKDVTVYGIDGDALTITRDTAGKAQFRNFITTETGQKRLMTDAEYAVKLRAESHVDELAQTSVRGNKTIPDSKNHKLAKDGFNYRSSYFMDFDGSYYRITMSVGKNGSINTIYNVGKIKETEYPDVALRPNRKTEGKLSSVSNTNISQSENGVNSHSMQETKKDTKFMLQTVGENDVEETKNLVAIHNLSEKKLLNALELGAFPVPSIAIVKAKDGHSSFGEISVVFDKVTIDPKNKKNKVYGSDIYSKRFPRIVQKIERSSQMELVDYFKDAYDEIGDSSYNLVEATNNTSLDDAVGYLVGDVGVQVQYMKEKKIKYVIPTYGNGKNVDRGKFRDEFNKKVDNIQFEKWVSDIFGDKFGEKYIRKDVDPFTASGNRKSFNQIHTEYNIKNLVKAMSGRVENSEGFSYGVGNIRAGMSKQFSNIGEIKTNENKLLRNEDFKQIKKQTEDDFYELLGKIQDYAKCSSDWFSISRELEEIALKTRDYMSFDTASNEFLFVANAPKELKRETYDFLMTLRDLPTEYFEAKPQRAVGFDEIKAVIIPADSSRKLFSKLKEKGISNIFEYDGTETDRTKKLNSIDNVRFMLPTTDSDDSDIQLYRNQQYISENKALKKQVEILKKRVDFFKNELTLTNGNKLSEKAIESFAKTMRNKYESQYDLEKLKGEMTALFEFIANNEDADYDNIIYQGSRIAKNILQQSSKLNKDLWNESKDFREYLKNTKIALSEAQKKEVAYYYGSYENFRKSLFGSMTFSKDGIMLDELWSEISNNPDFGYYFDVNTNELDQPMMLKQFIENVKPTYKDKFDGMDMDTASLGVGLEIYDIYFDIPKSVTFADKKKQELESLRSQYREQMSKWKADYKKEYSDKLIQTKKELKEKAKAIKSDALIKQKLHYETVRKNAKVRRDNTVVRHKILNVHSRLTSMLSQNTETKHVPVELIKSVVDVLEALNLNTMQDSTRKEDLYVLYAKATSDVEREQIQDRIDRLAKREENLQTKLLNASNLYSELKESQDYMLQNAYDETIGEDIAELKRVIGKTPVNKLSSSQLEMTYNVFKSVEHTVKRANKAFKDEKGETIEKMGNQILIELSELKKPSAKLSVANKLDEQGWALLTPVYAIRHIGSQTLSSAYSKIREGQDVWALDLDEAQRFAQSHYNSAYTNKKSLKKSYIVNLGSGEKIGITIDEAMSIYAYSRREQGVKHLLGGGFQFAHNVSKETIKADSKLGEKINKHLYYFKSSPFKLTIEDINSISNLLTDEQKTYVRNMQDYLSDVMGEKGNEVSMAMYGIKKFNEKNYFPLKSSRDFLSVKNENTQDSKLKKRSFTNKTIANANNPVVLEKFSSVWAKHVNEMAMYHGFALPIEDFTRIYNFKTRVTEDSSGQSVINELGSLYGNGASSYINHFLADINGNARSDPDTSIPAKALTTFKKGATFLSASVGIQQASAIGRALYLIDPKYFAKISTDKTSIFKPETWEEIKKYAPVAIIKEMGHFDMNMGRSTSDWLMKPEYLWKEKPVAFIKDSNYRDDLLSLFPSKSDEYTWCAIWNAIQSEVQDKQGLKIGTEENKVASGKRFSEVIDMTQVYDSTLSRSQLMRNKNVYISMATSFMSEPTVSLNMLTDGLYQAKRNGKEGKKIFARAVGAWLFSELLNALLKSIITAGRDDDEYDQYREKYVRHFFDNLSSGLFIPNLVPYVKDIVSVFQGYDIERADMTVVQDAYNAVIKICDKDIAWGEKVLEVVKTVSVFFGIPLKNAIRDAKMFGNVANGFKLDKELNSIDYKYAMKEGLLSGFTGGKYTPTGHFKRLYEAKRNGDTKKYDEIYHILKQSGKTDKKIISGLRSAMAENDERVMEAAKKKDKGDFVGYAKITQEIRVGGFEYNDVAKAVNSALTKLRKDEIEEDDNNEQRVSLYSYDDLNGAIENGDGEAVDLIVQEKIETKLANGGTEKDAKKAIKAQLTSYWKPEYISSDANERVEIRNKLLSTGVYDSMSDLNDLLARWRKETE